MLAVIVSLSFGCAADDKGKWDEFWKDVRGDNMKMRYDGWSKEENGSRPASTGSHD
jgi:hypothetical protein